MRNVEVLSGKFNVDGAFTTGYDGGTKLHEYQIRVFVTITILIEPFERK
jgi:hypothetical protein